MCEATLHRMAETSTGGGMGTCPIMSQALQVQKRRQRKNPFSAAAADSECQGV